MSYCLDISLLMRPISWDYPLEPGSRSRPVTIMSFKAQKTQIKSIIKSISINVKMEIGELELIIL